MNNHSTPFVNTIIVRGICIAALIVELNAGGRAVMSIMFALCGPFFPFEELFTGLVKLYWYIFNGLCLAIPVIQISYRRRLLASQRP